MKILIAFYSRSGVSRKVAEAMQRQLSCDMEEIIDLKDRKGALGFIVSCKDAALRHATEIKPPQKQPGDYDLVILGTPVWANTMSCAMRTYLTKFKDQFKSVAFFCTTGNSGIKSAMDDMQALCGKPPIAALGLKQKEVTKNLFGDKLAEFLKGIEGK